MPSPSPDHRGLHARVLDQLGAAVVAGRLASEAPVSVEDLEQSTGASRSVVREAVRVLESMGMVASRRRVGITVEPRELWNVFDPRLIRWRLDSPERSAHLRDLSALRRGFEPLAAELAAYAATPEQCARLQGAVMDMTRHAKARDLQAYLEADVVFHTTLLQASGNEMVAALHTVVAEVLAGRTHHHLMPADPNPAAIALHSQIASAVLAGDGEASRRAMVEIIDEAVEALEAQLDEAD